MNHKKTCFIVDSCTEIKNNEIKDVFCVPLTILENNNGQEVIYKDLEEINTYDIIQKIKAKKDLKTSQTSLGQMYEILEELTPKYERIFVIPISSGLSGSYNTWTIAQKEFEKNEIILLDAKDLGPGNKVVVELVLKMIKENKTNQEIIDAIEARKKRRLGTLVVTNLEQLKSGGRINKFKAVIAKTLKLNIIINFNGSLDFYDKDRSIDKAIDKCLLKLDQETNYKTKGIKHLFFYTTFLDEAKNTEIKAKIEAKLNTKPIQSLMPSIIAVHTGIDAFAIYLEAN